MIHDPQLRIRAAALSGARRSRPPRHRLRKARCHPADRGHYIGVVLDEDPKKPIGNYHPTHEMQYGEMAERLPLKEWLVLPLTHDWDDLTWNREARQDLVTAWAPPRSQPGTRPTSDLKIAAQHQGDAALKSQARTRVIRHSRCWLRSGARPLPPLQAPLYCSILIASEASQKARHRQLLRTSSSRH